jgi:hypothetical protein
VSEASAEGSRAVGEVARVVTDASAEGSRAVGDVVRAVSDASAESARAIAEVSTESARAVAEQFERIRESAEDERLRAADAMRSILERSNNDTASLFGDANERFSDAINGMKQMVSEMQRELEQARQSTQRELETMRQQMSRELDATRTELRRGVFDLPQETAESAAQMRRVIVDQIEALAELNRIVARHGRNLDAVEPVQRQEPALAIVGGRSDTTSLRQPPRQEIRQETRQEFRQETRQETRQEPRQEIRQDIRHEPRQERHDVPLPRPVAPRNEPAAFAPAARRTETSRTETPAPAAAGRGWLSDLLTRASRDETEPQREFQREQRDPMRELRQPEERTARHSIESLDSLSVDIARMIDHDAAADLWDRYKRGERNVFTRRLYTLQGQQAFDEIRKKYRGDREFKLTVDRYIGEFERLLDEVSRDDRGQVVARTYLTSETGKVYTMLAHAAGRFD